MLGQIENSVLIGINSLIFIAMGVVLKVVYSHRKEFCDHKDRVMYKDTCAEVQKRLDERHSEIKGHLERIESLIRNGGRDEDRPPKIQT